MLAAWVACRCVSSLAIISQPKKPGHEIAFIEKLSARIGLVQPFALVAAPLSHTGVLVYLVGCALRCRGTVSIVASIVRIVLGS
jgi:hypothetical protein